MTIPGFDAEQVFNTDGTYESPAFAGGTGSDAAVSPQGQWYRMATAKWHGSDGGAGCVRGGTSGVITCRFTLPNGAKITGQHPVVVPGGPGSLKRWRCELWGSTIQLRPFTRVFMIGCLQPGSGKYFD